MTRASLPDAERLLALLAEPDDVFELRALTKGRAAPQVTAGYFDDMGKLAGAAIALSGKADGVYLTINPVNPALLARAPANRIHQAGNGDTTSDRDVRVRRHLLVDVDPVRPTGISSTDAEHDASIALAERIATELGAQGWPEPILADSGNGGHLIYGIDLPVDDGQLVKRVLAALSKAYTTPEHKVDEKVFNPARISKVYGTLTRKGENTAERPHRLSRIIRAPKTLDVVAREQLEAFAPLPTTASREQPRTDRHHDRAQFDLDTWIAQHLPDAIAQPWSEGRKWLLPVCPFNDSHNRREAFVVEKHGGVIAAACQHESCFKSWRELRQHFEPDAYERNGHTNGSGNGNGSRLTDREPPPWLDLAESTEVLYENHEFRDEIESVEHPAPVVDEADAAVVRSLITIGDALLDLETLARAPVFDTPFKTLNDAIGFGGLIGTQVYTVAAGTGRGKTSWVAALATHAAGRTPSHALAEGIVDVPVIVATYEMKVGYFIARKAAGELGVHSNDIIRGRIAAGRVLEVVPFHSRLFLMRRPTLVQLRAAVRYLTKKHGTPPLVIVDYLQKVAELIAMNQPRIDMRLATTQASAALCDIAEETCCAIVAVSAIGRGKGKALSNPRRCDPHELVEVAKESGAVEYDGAGMIVLSLSKEYDEDGMRIATMTLAKTRFGEECHIEARYIGNRGTWLDRGRCTPTDQPSSTAAAESKPGKENREDVIRAMIANELKARPARNKTELFERLKGCRTASAREVFQAMFTKGQIAGIGGQLVLTTEGHQLVMEVGP
jgi:hypothetical protein